MAEFKKYFQHVKESRNRKNEEVKKWQTVEDEQVFFFPKIVFPALQDLSGHNSRFRFTQLPPEDPDINNNSLERMGEIVKDFEIEIRDIYQETEGRYELKIKLNQYLEGENLELHLSNYNSGKIVERTGDSEKYTKHLFHDQLEDMFIELHDKDIS